MSALSSNVENDQKPDDVRAPDYVLSSDVSLSDEEMKQLRMVWERVLDTGEIPSRFSLRRKWTRREIQITVHKLRPGN